MSPVVRWLAVAGGGAAVLAVLWMAVPPRGTAGAQLTEPAKLYAEEGFEPAAAKLFRLARSEAERGNIEDAIEAMQWAANEMAKKRRTNFELWDDLAELYCVQAKRERDPARAAAARTNAAMLLKEARCGAKYYDKVRPACFMDGTALPNPDMTPLCYTVLCTDGPKPPVAEPDTNDLAATAAAQRDIDEARVQRPPRLAGSGASVPESGNIADDRTTDEREAQATRLKFDESLTAANAAADTTYQAHYREDAANLNAIEASCAEPIRK